MTSGHRAWSPPGAAERPAVRSLVEEGVAAWSAHWFVGRQLRLSAWSLSDPGRRDVADWRPVGGGLEVSCRGRALSRVLALALDAAPDEGEATPRDRAVLDGFAQRLLEDLGRRLRTLIGASEDDAVRGDRMIATISDGADPLVHLTVPVASLAELSRRGSPRPRAASDGLAPRRAAVGDAKLRLDVLLGSARLSLAEARNLAPGDVLVLDRAIDAGAELCLAAGGAVVAEGRMTEVDGSLAIVLQPSARER